MLDFWIYRSSRGGFVLAWMTPAMSAHAYWPFKLERDAVAAAERMLGERR